MRTIGTAAAGCAIAVAACSLPNVGLWSSQGKADVGLYGLYGAKIAHGHVPYRSGFSLEFPPGAIPPLALPALPGSSYVSWFHAYELLCALAAVGAVAYALGGTPARRRYPAVAVAGAAPAFLGPISLNSFDLWPAALAAWAVALTLRGRPRWGLACLGLATAAKLYPVLLAPPLLAYAGTAGGSREARRAFAAGAATVAAVFLPFAALAPGGLAYSLREQAARGLQIESLGGSVLGAAHRLGAGFHVVVTHAPFSFDIAGGLARVLATVTSLAVLAAAWSVWRALRRAAVDRERTRVAVAALAVAFVAFTKVLSPQYLLFLVPLVPLVDSVAASLVLLGALALTQVWARFPEPFLHVTHLSGLIWVVLARNLVLVGLYALLLLALRRSRSTSNA
ncbi:MAG: glycosyltransferase 87 family protein [Gaiellaceae bacterium]